jgi:light-independent protochlorophyllide reductase subunit B
MEEHPDLVILTPTCTSSILQEDLQNFVNRAALESKCDVILADVNHYRVNELQAADRTLEQIVRYYLEKARKNNELDLKKTDKPSVNIIGIFTLGFHNQHDCRELKRFLTDLGITINEVIPEGGNVTNLKNLPKAHFNIVPYREVGLMTAMYLKNEFQMPYISTTPMGILNTAQFIHEIENLLKSQIFNSCLSSSLGNQFAAQLANANYQNQTNHTSLLHSQQQQAGTTQHNITKSTDSESKTHKLITEIFSSENQNFVEKNFQKYIQEQTQFVSQAAWFSRSIDCQNLTGKRAVVFGDATHAACMTKILACEMGIQVLCAGTYCKHDADWFREQVTGFCNEILITEDHTQVGDMIARLEPAAIFGTQMERHVGKRLDIPCGVISAPVHIQNFPLGYRPFLGYEGTNQIADLVYNSFTLGMEDHLLEIFNGHDTKSNIIQNLENDHSLEWSKDALQELSRIPGFVRGKVKRNVEKFASQNNKKFITLEIMFAAKEAVNA